VVNSYRNCIQAVIPAFTRFMRHIVDNADNASVFHCSAGKDRTGMAAALILSALDVPRDTIVADYMLTIEHYDSTRLIEIVEGHLRDAKVESWERSWLIPYCSVHQDNIVAFLEAIDAEYGDVRNYLTSALGLSDQDLIKIQESYLQD
jgi:protein-tyrosine phosphatase